MTAHTNVAYFSAQTQIKSAQLCFALIEFATILEVCNGNSPAKELKISIQIKFQIQQ